MCCAFTPEQIYIKGSLISTPPSWISFLPPPPPHPPTHPTTQRPASYVGINFHIFKSIYKNVHVIFNRLITSFFFFLFFSQCTKYQKLNCKMMKISWKLIPIMVMYPNMFIVFEISIIINTRAK